jgi:prolipoprotein diacylglyceryltransferase
MELSLLWAAMTAFGLGWLGLLMWDEGVPEHSGDRLLTAALVGLLAGRLGAMVIQGLNPLTHPADFLVLRGGVSTEIASLGFIATLLWKMRAKAGTIDAVAPAILLALAGWHGGCLWRGSCLGTASDLPWAWAQDQSLVTRHPVELYAALSLALGAYLVSRLGWRPWLRAGASLMIAAGVRLFTEPLRPSIMGGPLVWYAAGIAAGAFVVIAGPRLVPNREAEPT